MSESPDPDLRDVFRLLYDDADWDTFSDKEDLHPPLDSIVPDLEVEIVEQDVELPKVTSERYSKKRIFETLDSLFNPTLPKRRRIYPTPARPPSIYTSTLPLPLLPSPTAYAPFSPLALLARLRTYQPASFSPSCPPELSPIVLARQGWVIAGRETLTCGMCGAVWGLQGLVEIQDEKVRREVGRRMGLGSVERHGRGCAWRVRRSPENVEEIYTRIRKVVHPMLSSSFAPLAQRLEEECLAVEGGLNWSCPLGEKRLSNLATSLSRYTPNPPDLSTGTDLISSARRISPTAHALAFFAWYPYHPNSTSPTINIETSAQRSEIVQCRICERRVGLWSFRLAKRCFDLVNEHLVWCPIRAYDHDGKGWWEGTPLSGPPRVGSIWDEAGGIMGVLKVSEKLQRKPWRRA